jgi:gliding motility-associated-like protein
MSSTGNPNAVETVGTNNVFVTVTSFYGCEAKDSTIVIVNALPKHLSEQDKIYTFISGQTQDVELKTDPQNINTNCNFEWRDNDSLYVSSDSPIYAVAPEEDFYYLTIITQDGCDITEKIEVIIKPANIEPYNVITPNGDDVNDYWVINFIEFYPLAEVTIFNRNGNMVYKPTTNYGPTNHFTGIYDNVTKKTLPAGVYFYVIDMSKYSDYKENNKELKGTLTIIKD